MSFFVISLFPDRRRSGEKKKKPVKELEQVLLQFSGVNILMGLYLLAMDWSKQQWPKGSEWACKIFIEAVLDFVFNLSSIKPGVAENYS